MTAYRRYRDGKDPRTGYPINNFYQEQRNWRFRRCGCPIATPILHHMWKTFVKCGERYVAVQPGYCVIECSQCKATWNTHDEGSLWRHEEEPWEIERQRRAP